MLATDERLTTSAAARVAGVSEQTIRMWAAAGTLPSEITPLGRLFRSEDLDAVIAARTRHQHDRSRTDAQRRRALPG